jgi:acetylornithine deacetylase/succinyl-diaminopimelate desuccinylase-like protein
LRRLAVLILLVASLASGQPRAARAAREWRQAHETAILAEFVDLLKIPNVASDRDNIHRNAAALRAMLEKRGVRTALWETEGAPPVVFGSLETPGAAAAVVMYAHYDGQPADPKEWAGHGPWDPVLRSGPLEDGGRVLLFPVAGGAYDPEWRLYGRSTSDDKAPILAALAALDAPPASGAPSI